MAYSLDFRRRVFRIKEEENLTFQQTAQRFQINIRTLFRWEKRIEPILKRNKPATKINMQALAEDVKKHPDDYQYERAKRFNVSTSCIKYALRRLRVTFKKKRFIIPRLVPRHVPAS